MAINLCFCWNIKDGAVTVGLWSLIYGLVQLAVFGWQMAAIKYEKDRAADTILPDYYKYGRLDIHSYYESYWQNPEERFYTGLFVIQVLCLIASFFLLFASCSLIYGAHTYSRCLIWPWLPCMIASILCTLAYCITWWSGDVRDYWLLLTILEMLTIFVNLYCVFVVLLFYRHISNAITHYNGKKSYSMRMYDKFKKNGNYLPELEHPVKSGYRRNVSPRRDQCNRLLDNTKLQQQSIPTTPTNVRKTTFADDLVSTWVKEQQQSAKDLLDHASNGPVTQHKLGDICSLKHSFSVPSIDGRTSGTKCCHRHRHKHCHRRHHRHSNHCRCQHHRHHHHHKHRSSSRRLHRDDQEDHHGLRRNSSRRSCRFPSVTSSSGSVSTDYYSDNSYPVGRRPRSSETVNAATDDFRIAERHRSRRTRFENYHEDSRRFKDCQHVLRKSRHNQVNSGNASPTVAMRADSVTSHWPLDPQKGLTLPQQIVIPPSHGNIGPDGHPQPQTYQISSEIRISYDQKDRPASHKVSTLPGPVENKEQSPSYLHPRPYSVISVV